MFKRMRRKPKVRGYVGNPFAGASGFLPRGRVNYCIALTNTGRNP